MSSTISRSNPLISLYILRNPSKVLFYLVLYIRSLIIDAINYLRRHSPILISIISITAVILYTLTITLRIPQHVRSLLLDTLSMIFTLIHLIMIFNLDDNSILFISTLMVHYCNLMMSL